MGGLGLDAVLCPAGLKFGDFTDAACFDRGFRVLAELVQCFAAIAADGAPQCDNSSDVRLAARRKCVGGLTDIFLRRAENGRDGFGCDFGLFGGFLGRLSFSKLVIRSISPYCIGGIHGLESEGWKFEFARQRPGSTRTARSG